MESTLHSLAYFSRNSIAGDPDEMRRQIGDILSTARSNNLRHGVTGALLFSDGCFAQVLEGPRASVETIFEHIQCDPRHCDVTILHLHPVEQRSFPAWSMAFAGIEGVSVDPKLQSEGMGEHGNILSTEGGRQLLAALHSVVHRDDAGRRLEGSTG